MYTRGEKCWVEEAVVGRRGISIGKQTAAGSLARKMNKIMKEGKISRVDGGGEKKEEWMSGGEVHCQLFDSKGMKRAGRTSTRITEGARRTIFVRRV